MEARQGVARCAPRASPDLWRDLVRWRLDWTPPGCCVEVEHVALQARNEATTLLKYK